MRDAVSGTKNVIESGNGDPQQITQSDIGDEDPYYAIFYVPAALSSHMLKASSELCPPLLLHLLSSLFFLVPEFLFLAFSKTYIVVFSFRSSRMSLSPYVQIIP